MALRALFPLTLILLPSALAGWGKFEYDLDEAKRPWQEAQTRLPAYPRPEHLVPFEVGAASGNRYYIDEESLSVGEDGVVRYTVVVRTPGGAENVRLGTRCDDGQHKLYAFGHPDGKGGGAWRQNRHARWAPIQARQASSYHRVLFYHYFCTVEGKGDLAAIRRHLRQGGLDRRDGAGVW